MRNNIHRGIVALAVVSSLAAAGSRPAAAANLGFLDRLNQLWSAVTGSPGAAPHQAPGRSHRAPTKSGAATGTTDRGWGIDPNGNSIVANPGVPSSNG